MQFSSIKTMSVDRTELIFPIFPSVKYPIGILRRCAPSSMRFSANTINPAADCSRSAACWQIICKTRLMPVPIPIHRQKRPSTRPSKNAAKVKNANPTGAFDNRDLRNEKTNASRILP